MFASLRTGVRSRVYKYEHPAVSVHAAVTPRTRSTTFSSTEVLDVEAEATQAGQPADLNVQVAKTHAEAISLQYHQRASTDGAPLRLNAVKKDRVNYRCRIKDGGTAYSVDAHTNRQGGKCVVWRKVAEQTDEWQVGCARDGEARRMHIRSVHLC
eukprot:7382589-Prymnesium_polylepis.2